MIEHNKTTQEIIDLNPLNRFKSYQLKHIIMGFRFSEDACTFDITGDVGPIGTVVGENPNYPKVASTNCKGPRNCVC